MNQVVVKAGRDKRIRGGHLWVNQGEIGIIEIGVKPGDVVEILDSRGRFLGKGYFNPGAQIAIRLLTRNRNEAIDKHFFRQRILQALDYRRQICPAATSYRLIHSEGDLLPGLIVDKYEEYLVVQFLTLGMELWREVVIELLIELCQPVGIIEHNDQTLRRLEDLPERKGCLYGAAPAELVISDNQLNFVVDLSSDQEMKYPLDQSANRAALAKYVNGKNVLDCFCNMGGFAIHAAAYGAKSVLGVDISETAVQVATKNAALNGLEQQCQFKVANAFDYLREQVGHNQLYDLIVLDPPAFAKNKQVLDRAIQGYREIGFRALKLIAPGGILVTCSSSQYIDADLFWEIINTVAVDARRRLRLLERRSQGLDFPVLVGIPETEYLKCFIFEVM